MTMPRFSANLTMLFGEHDFLDRFDAAARAGFKGVEYIGPYDHPHGGRRRAAEAERPDAGAVQSAGRRLGARASAASPCLPDRVRRIPPRRRQGDRLCAGARLRAGQLPGRHRAAGRRPPSVLRETFVDNLRFAAEELEKAGIRLLIEPINTRDIPGFFLTGTQPGAGAHRPRSARTISCLQYDIYHMQIMEGDLARTIEANLGRIAHIQLADNPGRHEPGTGEINYPFLYRASRQHRLRRLDRLRIQAERRDGSRSGLVPEAR